MQIQNDVRNYIIIKNNLYKTFVFLNALKCLLHGYSSFLELTAAGDAVQ